MLGANPAKGPASYRSVDATVLKVVSDMVFFRTNEKTIRNISMKELIRSGMPSIKPGDRVNLVLDRGNMIRVIAEPATKGFDDTRTALAVDQMNR